MSVKRKGLERQSVPIEPIDPAVESALGEPDFYSKLKRARKMTPSQKKKAERERKRNRVILDLPKNVEDILSMLSDEEVVSKSQIATYLIILGLQNLEEKGEGALSWVKHTSAGLRYVYDLTLPEIPKKFEYKLKQYREKILVSANQEAIENNGTVNGTP
ncbi:MAG: hypothetical protein ACPL1K_07470 [Candidatus Kryptoniota bacterium]